MTNDPGGPHGPRRINRRSSVRDSMARHSPTASSVFPHQAFVIHSRCAASSHTIHSQSLWATLRNAPMAGQPSTVATAAGHDTHADESITCR